MLRLSVRSLQWQSPSRVSGWVATAASARIATATPTAVSNNQHTITTSALQSQDTTEFTRRASAMKKRWRGRGQYGFARAEAQRFLDSEVPKGNLGAWMEEGSNAIALSQLLSFFEIQPEASLASLILNKLIRTAEDESTPLISRLQAALSLICTRPDENYERVFHVIAQALQQLHRIALDGSGNGSSTTNGVGGGGTGRVDNGTSPVSPAQMLPFDAVGVCAKALQRCGKRTPPMLNEQLTAFAMALLQKTPATNLPYVQATLLRLYAWMVRAERSEANQLLYILIEQTGEFARHDFSTLMVSCVRHHQLMHLPVELIQRLARVAFQYRNSFNGRDGAAILGTLAKLVVSLTAGANGVTAADVVRAQDYFNALLEEMQQRVLRLFDVNDKLFWRNSEDMSSCAFAYELGGHVRYHRVFQAYAAYVQHSVEGFEPPQLALATGILRRAQLLTPHLATRLSERIEVVLGELRLAELSHICATFAALPSPRPGWWDEARAVALRLLLPDVSGLVSMNLAIAFPEQPGFAETIDYAQITSRQLVDLLPLTLESAQFGEAVVAMLCQRLASQGERFAPDDLRLLLACGERPQLVQAAQEHLREAFAQPVWSTDTLYSLPLVIDASHPERNLQRFSVAKALAAAKTASVGPAQFVSLAELLLSSFGDTDQAVREYIQAGGDDLVKEKGVYGGTIVRYLSVVRRFPSMVPPTQWLHDYADMLETQMPGMDPDNLEDVLLSLRTLYEDVAKTPALQMVLSSLVRRFYEELADSEQTARITVLVVYLQNGMTLPLLTASSPTLQRVTSKESQYTPEVRRALAMMPIPKALPAEERRGRFVLKHLEPAHRSSEAAMPLLDLNLGDPFLDSLSIAEPAAKPPTQPPVVAEAPSAPSSAPATETAASAPETETVAAPPPPSPREEKPMSYYAKFFSSSVGQIFVGRGDRSHEEKKPATPSEPAVPPREEESPKPEAPPQPRRTRLHPSAHTSVAAAAAVPAAPVAEGVPSQPQPTQQQPSSPAATPVAVPVTTFTTAWGSMAPPPAGPGWGFAAAATSQSTLATAEKQHSSAFSSLFGMPPIPSLAAAAPASAPKTKPAPVAAPAASRPVRMGGMGGNNIFFNPRNPSASRGRPVMSHKAVITRPGLHGAAATTTGAAVGRTPPAATASETVFNSAAAEGMRRVSVDTARTSHVSPLANAPVGPPIARNAAAAPTADAAAAAANRHERGNGMEKISGYNIGEGSTRGVVAAAGGSSAAPFSAGGQESRPALDWMDAARRVGRVTRLPRSKTKTRTQHNLSAWLNTPSARLDSPAKEETGEAASEPPAAGRGRQATVAEVVKGRRSKRDASKSATEAAAHDDAGGSHAKRGGGGRGRGRGGKAGAAGGKAAKATKAAGCAHHHGRAAPTATQAKKKGGKAAAAGAALASSSKKGTAAKSAKAAASSKSSGSAGNNGLTKRAASTTVAVKPAKKAVKAAAKKVTAAAAKKPAKGKK
ncbi:conserved hypothetical protein [Leishmania major strain Friedlin]|uniref:Uncharacterized protein n=1 Tax=Leishmania major TaxID=5664 RepID=Q4Q9P1_LEIMA|nr:conserved hypothetical protein [Leishmania major strain Friedlin]CAG9575220.1 hypothetical_protein_-_conserved [Leishmania major strain Friedlin]CAJ05493.1 conserved hypothetical protein [Leishmania major strain Friedlin]|eukprot:XP_001683957.1 conserved hypothetical protein [Leishmania major strain Friedlin]